MIDRLFRRGDDSGRGRRPGTVRAALAALAVVAVVADLQPLGAAQEPKRDTEEVDQSAFFDVVTVDVVNVDVYVTDKQGNHVTGLTKDDFEVLEDGRPVAITNFYAVVDEAPSAAPPVRAATPVERPTTTTAEAVPDDQRLYLIVYIDNFNIRPFNRNRVFHRLREFLNENVGAGDKVMLVTYNRSFKERVPFTSDPALINSALFEIETETGYGVHRDSERRDAIRAIDEAESVSEALGHIRAYAGSYYNDTMFTIDALKQLVSSLGGLPGRKALIYVSDGLPLVPAEDLFHMMQEKFRDTSALMQSREFDCSRRYREAAAQANSNRVTFYTIDAAGLRPPESVSAQNDRAAISSFVDSQNVYNLQAPLLQLAEDTGGRAIINSNDIGERLVAVGRDLRSYYSLGYQPAHAGDGRYHRIDVKVKRKGLQVRHRTGYRDKGLEQRMADGTMAALLFGEVGNPLGVGIEFGEATQRQDGNALVPVHVHIPLDRVVLVPQGDHHEARLRVFVAASDDDGGLSPVQNLPVPIRIPAGDIERARQSSWRYDVTLLMRTGPHRVAVGLRDELGGVSSFTSSTLFVRGK